MKRPRLPMDDTPTPATAAMEFPEADHGWIDTLCHRDNEQGGD